MIIFLGETPKLKQGGTPVISVTDESGDQRMLADDNCDDISVTHLDSLEDIPVLLNSDHLQKTVSGSFEVALSEFCSRLATPEILGLVERAVTTSIPPTIHSYSKENTLALEYPCGLQVGYPPFRLSYS